MHEFRVGDVVKIINSEAIHGFWVNRIGIIIGSSVATWVVQMDDTGQVGHWLAASLEFLGTEQSLALEVLGDEYYA